MTLADRFPVFVSEHETWLETDLLSGGDVVLAGYMTGGPVHENVMDGLQSAEQLVKSSPFSQMPLPQQLISVFSAHCPAWQEEYLHAAPELPLQPT